MAAREMTRRHFRFPVILLPSVLAVLLAAAPARADDFTGLTAACRAQRCSLETTIPLQCCTGANCTGDKRGALQKCIAHNDKSISSPCKAELESCEAQGTSCGTSGVTCQLPGPPNCAKVSSASACTSMGGTVSTACSCCFQDCAPFTKVTTGDIVTTPAVFWNGSWGDYDDDGYLDLFVGATVASRRNFLYHNNRDGTFTLIDDAKMPKIPSDQHGAAWGDYDNDGHLDLIVTAGNARIFHNVLYHNNGDGTFTGITSGAIYEDTSSFGFHGPSWGDYDNDGFLDLFIAGHDIYNRLFHNNGDGSFTRITSGVLVDAASDSEGRAWVDYNNDGHLDLFVSNASTYTNALYRNDGNGVFTPVMNELTSRVENTIAVCWADYDNDGFLDLFLANAQKNSLYHNNGDGTFTSITDSAVVADTLLPNEFFASCAWGDYDNDGFIDLFVTAGEKCRDQTSHNFLYHNNGDGTFTKVTEGSIVRDRSDSAGASWGDYDNDGFLDLFVSQASLCRPVPDEVPNLLYHNNGNSNAWLNVKLVGTVSNRSAIGAKVRVKAFYRGESRWQMRDVSGGDSQSNQQSLNAEFGLADATNIDTVRIEWPSGIVQEMHDVAPRQFLTIEEAP